MRSAVEIRRCHAGRHSCSSPSRLDDSVLRFARCPVDNDCLRASRAKQVNGVLDGRPTTVGQSALRFARWTDAAGNDLGAFATRRPTPVLLTDQWLQPLFKFSVI